MTEQFISKRKRDVFYSFASPKRIWRGDSLAEVSNSEAEYFIKGTYETSRIYDLDADDIDDLFSYHLIRLGEDMQVNRINDWEVKCWGGEFESDDQIFGSSRGARSFQISDPFGLLESFWFPGMLRPIWANENGLKYFENINNDFMMIMADDLLRVCEFDSWIDYHQSRK